MPSSHSEKVQFTGDVDASGSTNFFHKAGSVTPSDLSVGSIQDHPTNFALAVGGAPAAREEVVAVCRGAGTIKYAYAGLVDTGTATVSVDVDFNKNGTTILSADINVDHGDADRAHVAGVLSVTTVAAGDVITASLESVTANDSTGPFAVIGIEYTATKT